MFKEQTAGPRLWPEHSALRTGGHCRQGVVSCGRDPGQYGKPQEDDVQDNDLNYEFQILRLQLWSGK